MQSKTEIKTGLSRYYTHSSIYTLGCAQLKLSCPSPFHVIPAQSHLPSLLPVSSVPYMAASRKSDSYHSTHTLTLSRAAAGIWECSITGTATFHFSSDRNRSKMQNSHNGGHARLHIHMNTTHLGLNTQD